MNKWLVIVLMVSGVANAASYKYTCSPSKGNPTGFDSKVTLTISPQAATIDMADGSYKSSGKFNEHFIPRTNKNMLQYIGFANNSEYAITMLAGDSLPSGGLRLPNGGGGGFLIIRGQGEDFVSGSYVCNRKIVF